MSRYSGRQGRGKARIVKDQKREEAQARDEALPADSPKRRKNRDGLSLKDWWERQDVEFQESLDWRPAW